MLLADPHTPNMGASTNVCHIQKNVQVTFPNSPVNMKYWTLDSED
jgi:hypothetical protein